MRRSTGVKLLFDQNLSHRLTALLVTAFPGSVHVREIGLATGDDADVWDYARANGFCIISKDSDFQQRALLHGQPPKVIWLSIGNCATADVESLLNTRRTEIVAFDADPTATVLVLR